MIVCNSVAMRRADVASGSNTVHVVRHIRDRLLRLTGSASPGKHNADVSGMIGGKHNADVSGMMCAPGSSQICCYMFLCIDLGEGGYELFHLTSKGFTKITGGPLIFSNIFFLYNRYQSEPP